MFRSNHQPLVLDPEHSDLQESHGAVGTQSSAVSDLLLNILANGVSVVSFLYELFDLGGR